MVIHDMRNPTNNIEYAIKEVLQVFEASRAKDDVVAALGSQGERSPNTKIGTPDYSSFLKSLTSNNGGNQVEYKFSKTEAEESHPFSGQGFLRRMNPAANSTSSPSQIQEVVYENVDEENKKSEASP